MEGVVQFLAYLRSLDVHLTVENGALNCSAPKGVLTKELKERLRENKFSLITSLQQGETHANAGGPLVPVSREGFLPPSSQQKRLWFLEQFEQQNAAYNLSFLLRVKGPLNRIALENSWKEIIRRHEVLRTSIVNADGKPRAVVLDSFAWNLGVHSLREVTETERDQALMKFALDYLSRPFDLSAAPLVRVTLVELGDNDHAIVSSAHHIAADGWSLSIIGNELQQLYSAFCQGKASPLSELPIQYLDYAQWNRQRLQSDVMQTQLSYWKQKLAGPLPIADLPFDRPRPKTPTFRGRRSVQIMPAGSVASAQKFSNTENVTLFTMLLTTFKILVYRYTREADVMIGTVTAGRVRPELEKLVGLFLNSLPLRTDLSQDPTVRELLGRVRETTLSAFSNQDVSFGDLVEMAHESRDLNRSPLFQLMFILQNFPWRNLELAGLEVVPMKFNIDTTRFDLTIEAMEDKNDMQLVWEYNTDLFDSLTIERMQRHYEQLLAGVMAFPERRISELEMMTEDEHRTLASASEKTRAEFPREQCIHDAFTEQVTRHPEAIAVVFGGEQLTYHELDLRSNRLANRLRSLGVGPDRLVGLCLERSANLPVALLAVLKAGGAYVPVDPQYPQDRIALMLEDSSAAVVITEERLLGILPANTSAAILCLDRDRESLAQESSQAPSGGVSAENLAYVIYTSGSTGKPKGVQLTHRSVINFLASMRREPGLTNQDRLLAVTTLSFDIAGLEFYLPLTTGACVVVAPRSALLDGAALADLIQDSNVTVMQATPVTWRLLLDSGWTGAPGLKILCGGEAFPRELANRLLSCGSEVWNLYGPTETTIWSTVHRVDAREGSVPIGKPIDNTQIYILDEYKHPVPNGVAAELYIGGDGLARGYWQRPELTAERFVENPFQVGEKLYRTGDLVRWLPDGNLEYIRRLDNQVKLRGYRIELGEIETALERQPDIRQAIVLVREDTPNDQRLTAYLILQDSGAKDTAAIRAGLLSGLPEFMVPTQFVFLDAFPLTPNRKIDRKALPAPESNANNSALYVPPKTESEIKVAAIWQTLLKHPRVGVKDNFFDLGGHSLLVVQLQAMIRKQFKREITLVELFQRPTVSAIASLLDVQNGKTQAPAQVEVASMSRT